jgi:CBS domain-containing protein
MADYNLHTIPVVDDGVQLLGVVTVDDVLKTTIPDDWRRRGPGPRPVRESISVSDDSTGNEGGDLR